MPGRVVAELGRPETPEETAARKAEASRIHRSSRTARNLVAALVATLAVVAVLVFAVPRGDAPPATDIDVSAVAGDLGEAQGETLLVSDVPDTWRVNAAGIQGEDDVPEWTVVYVPAADAGFVRIVQALGADSGWLDRELHGTAPSGTLDVDGVTWQVYEPDDPADAGNVSYALSTTVGDDTLLISSSTDAETAQVAASGLADPVRAADEAAG